jgi:hypothetical protein
VLVIEAGIPFAGAPPEVAQKVVETDTQDPLEVVERDP